MSFGARRDDEGVWRLCERRGRLITQVSAPPDNYPIAFPSREAAEACAEELNDRWWQDYRRDRRMTRGYSVQRGILETIVSHGGLSSDDMESAFV